MINIIEECNSVIEELHKFATDIVYLGPSITDSRIEAFETQIGFTLPLDFKYIMKRHNGISLAGVEIYGFDVKLKASSLDEVYKFEHFDTNHKMPSFFLPFSPDGRGNHYCINLSKMKEGRCPIVFWQWDFNYKNIDEVEECNDDFVNWIKEEMIDWTLEDTNYDGTEK